MRFLYTHINQWLHDKRAFLLVRGRKQNGERVQVIFYGFWPRFFVRDKDLKRKRDLVHQSYKIVKVMKWRNQKHPVYGDILEDIYGNPISLVLVRVPKDVRDSHGKDKDGKPKGYGVCNTIFNDCETFMSDIPYEYTFLIWAGVTSGIEVPDKPDKIIKGFPAYHWKKIVPFDDLETETKVGTVDIENYHFKGKTDMKNPEIPLTAISLWNFKSPDMYQHLYDPEDPFKKFMKTKLVGVKNNKYNLFLHSHLREKELIKGFVKDFTTIDNDIDTGWNSDFDYNYIIGRAKKLEVDEIKDLSPWPFLYDSVSIRGKVPHVAGRTLMDEMHVYMKHTIFEGLKHSYKLDSVAWDELKERKIPKRTENGKLLTVGQLLRYSLPTFLKYNAIDSELVGLIDGVKGLWKFKDFQRRKMGVPIQTTLQVSAALHVVYNREAMMRGKAFPARKEREGNFKGGYVFPPSPGLQKEAVSFDFKAMYATIIRMWNISLETFVGDPTKESMEYLKTCIKTPNGIYLKPKSECVGILADIVDKMSVERDKMKQDYLEAREKYGKDDKRVEGLNMAQMYQKANINSVYGTLVFYLLSLALTVTAIARDIIQYAAKMFTSIELHNEISMKFGLMLLIKFLYGDTDSCYNGGIDPLNERLMEFIGTWVSEKVNDYCVEKYNVSDRLFKTRAEASYDSFFMADKKKCYAGHKCREYKETAAGGKWVVVDYFDMTGFEKSDISEIGNRAFESMIEQICLSARHKFDLYGWISKHLKKLRGQITRLDFDLKDLCPTTRWGKSSYKTLPIAVKAAQWSNDHLGTSFEVGDKIPYIYVYRDKTKVIALPEDWGVKEVAQAGYLIDKKTMFEKQIENKFKPILSILKFDVVEMLKGVKQQRMDDLR